MIHEPLGYSPDAHFGVSENGQGSILFQLQDEKGSQARVILDPNEALYIAVQLINMVQWVNEKYC